MQAGSLFKSDENILNDEDNIHLLYLQWHSLFINFP